MNHKVVNFISGKWFIVSTIILSIIFSIFIDIAQASASYHPLECSEYYSGYCNKDQDCYDEFGEDGLNYLGFCFNVPGVPQEYPDELTALELLNDKTDLIISGNIFLYNIVGFWLPFGVILNFILLTLFFILVKFGYLRKK